MKRHDSLVRVLGRAGSRRPSFGGRRALAAVIAAAVGSLVLAGCGSAGNDAVRAGDSEAAPSTPAAARATRFAIGTNPAGTSYYAVGGGIAKLLQRQLGVAATVRPYAGSSVYLPLIERGELPLGLNTGIDAHFAYSAAAVYESPMRNLRLLILLWPIRHSYLARADSGLSSIEDLAGKRVVTDLAANAFLGPFHRAILATGGLAETDVTAINASGLPEGLSLLTQGRVDATPAAIDLALVRQADAAIPGGIRYLSLGRVDPQAPARVPGGSVVTAVPTAVTTGFDEPFIVPAFHTFLDTSTALSEADAYAITRAVYEGWDALSHDYPVLAETPRDALAPADVPIPYHAGAVRFYREHGLWTDAHEANRRKLLDP